MRKIFYLLLLFLSCQKHESNGCLSQDFEAGLQGWQIDNCQVSSDKPITGIFSAYSNILNTDKPLRITSPIIHLEGLVKIIFNCSGSQRRVQAALISGRQGFILVDMEITQGGIYSPSNVITVPAGNYRLNIFCLSDSETDYEVRIDDINLCNEQVTN